VNGLHSQLGLANGTEETESNKKKLKINKTKKKKEKKILYKN
jgi:hypothetical protein